MHSKDSLCFAQNAYLSTSCSACSISALISPKSYKAAPNSISRADSSSACLRRVSPGVQHYIPKVSQKQYRGGSKEAEATLQRTARAGRTCRSRLGFWKRRCKRGSPLFTFHAGGSELRLCFFRDSRRFSFTFFRKEKSEEEVGSCSSRNWCLYSLSLLPNTLGGYSTLPWGIGWKEARNSWFG